MVTRQLTLKATDRKPPQLGPKVRVEALHLNPAGDEAGLTALISGAGLRDWRGNGLVAQDTSPKHMWRGACPANLSLEFELPDAVPLGAIRVWNYNAEWQTKDGIRKADVAVSPDGSAWETVLRGAEFAEAEGAAGYDEPVQLKLSGATVRKVRFENIVPWNDKGKVGLSKVIFYQAPGVQAGPRIPEDGATGIGSGKRALEWVAGQGATEHKVFLGTAADSLAPVGATTKTRLEAQELKPDATYFWRVDEVQADGHVVTGRIARFATSALVAWWKLDEASGSAAGDASGHQLTGDVVGRAIWAPRHGRIGGALEFDGRTTYVDCGLAPEFDFSSGMTVAAWIKVREFNKAWQAIVTKGDTAWRLQRQKDTGVLTFILNNGSEPAGSLDNAVRVVSKRKVDDSEWHHVVGLSDGRRTAIYVDGELEDSADAKPIAQNSAAVRIGSNSDTRGRGFNGWIHDVRLYGYGLSESEVKALYRAETDSLRAAK